MEQGSRKCRISLKNETFLSKKQPAVFQTLYESRQAERKRIGFIMWSSESKVIF